MGERPRTWQQAERRALVADLVRTQAVLQARTEQLQRIFESRWYRLARFAWRLRRGAFLRKNGPPRLAAEESFAQPLDGGAEALTESAEPRLPAERAPIPGLEADRMCTASRQRKRMLVASHSFTFCTEIERLARRRDAAVRQDRWQTHRAHDEEASAAALAWADVILCEWCLGNAVWYSRNKLPGQRLVVRFHRMELETPYPGELDLEQIDALVFVAEHVRESACARWGWDAADPRFHIVPNGIDLPPLRRPKLPGAEYTLAMIGYVPRLKRPDLALDVLELLLRRDKRYRLLIKGREPWELTWMAGRDEEREYYEGLRRRLDNSPSLRAAVELEPFGDDIPAFLRRVGWILSTSEVEGHSVALAEAMASGAVPAILERPGAADQYEAHWAHRDPAAAAAAILATNADGRMDAEMATARQLGLGCNWELLGLLAWERLLLGQGREAVALTAFT